MGTVQLSRFEISDYPTSRARKSITKYLSEVVWDNYVEMALRGACTFISSAALIMITTVPCSSPEVTEAVTRGIVERRRKKRLFGTNIINGDNCTMYISWHRDSLGRIVYRDTVLDGNPGVLNAQMN